VSVVVKSVTEDYNLMNVQQMIDKLNLVEDKNQEVVISWVTEISDGSGSVDEIVFDDGVYIFSTLFEGDDENGDLEEDEE